MKAEVESVHNPLVQEIRRLARPRERRSRGLCVAEGVRLVAEAAAAGLPIETLCVLDAYAGPLPPAGRVLRVGARALAAMATTATPQPVLAVVRIPRPPPAPAAFPVRLAVDGLQDPGNLGMLLRVALAFGAAPVALGPGTADAWGPKALRAAAGATFHRPPVRVDDLAAWVRASGGARWALSPRGGLSLDAASFERPGPVTLVVGSEAGGVSAAVAAVCRPLTIPMEAPVESLNAAVACAVALHEVARRRGRPPG